jgi:uncharacterized protein YgiM (DUF1202 family)
MISRRVLMSKTTIAKLLSLVFIFSFVLSVKTGFTRNIQCVWKSAVNVRSGPGINNEVLFIAWRYEPLTVLETSGNWTKVAEHYRGLEKVRVLKGEHPHGLIGWLYNNPKHSPSLRRTRCLSVRAEFLNFRTGPGTRFRPGWRMEWGYSFKYLEQKNGWYKVTDGETTGWVSSYYVWSPWL